MAGKGVFIGKGMLLLALAALVPPGPAAGEDPPSLLEAVNDLGAGWMTEFVPEGVLDSFEIPTPQDWARFWSSLQSIRETGSLEEFAWMLPEVDAAIDVLDAVEGGEPYADWLRQRRDFFDVASQVATRFPAAATAPPARRPGAIVPPKCPKPARVSPDVARKRLASIRSVALWKKKIAGRRPPARAANLVPSIKREFSREGVPVELVWLAEVESSFNPKARSPAGARGLFQFMPATAKRFGLRTTGSDERLDPRKSARAAARYLKVLYHRLGSWPLALAAYNAGEGRVGRAMKKNAASSFEAVVPHLPLETQMYVPKVLATIALREGVDPATLPPPRASG